jgi:membrane protease YdiL (CAAX protease family)
MTQEESGLAVQTKSAFNWSLVPIGLLLLAQWGMPLWLLPSISQVGPGTRYIILTLFRFILIGWALWLERGHWGDFFITRRNLKPALRDGLWLSLLFVPIAWAYAHLSLGGIHWLPRADWLPTFLAALIPAGLQEELAYRALFLGLVNRRWRISSLWSILLIGLLFGPIHHSRYIWRSDFLTLSIVTAFGLVAAWLTLRRQNVAGAIIGHTAMDFLIFLFIGGKVTTL